MINTIVEWQWLRCLKAGKFYPDYAGTEGPVGLRYCGEGDLIFVRPDDVQWLLDGQLCERYIYDVKKKAPDVFLAARMVIGDENLPEM